MTERLWSETTTSKTRRWRGSQKKETGKFPGPGMVRIGLCPAVIQMSQVSKEYHLHEGIIQVN